MSKLRKKRTFAETADGSRSSTDSELGDGDDESSVRSAAEGRIHFADGSKRPSLFCYLMFDSNDKELRTTSIDTAADPAGAVLAYKMGQKKHRKGGRSNPRDWCLEQWIGPFRKKETARSFQARWSHCKKSLSMRTLRGAKLAIEYSNKAGKGARIYTYSMHPTQLVQRLRDEKRANKRRRHDLKQRRSEEGDGVDEDQDADSDGSDTNDEEDEDDDDDDTSTSRKKRKIALNGATRHALK